MLESFILPFNTVVGMNCNNEIISTIGYAPSLKINNSYSVGGKNARIRDMRDRSRYTCNLLYPEWEVECSLSQLHVNLQNGYKQYVRL